MGGPVSKSKSLNRIRRTVGNLALLLLVNAAVFTLVEVTAGFFVRSGPAADGVRPEFVRDPHLFWYPEGLLRTIDEAGESGDDRRIILNFGDSVTMGLDVPPGRNYSNVLGAMLDEDGKDNWKVMNLGVEAYSTLQVKRLLERALQKLKPEVVTFLVGWNDHWRDGVVPDKEVKYYGGRVWQTVLKLNSARLLAKALSPRLYPRRVIRVPLADFEENLEALVSLCREQGSRVVFILPVYYRPRARTLGVEEVHLAYTSRIWEAAQRNNTGVLDLVALFHDRRGLFVYDRGYPEQEVIDFIHPGEEGHRIIAEGLYGMISALP